MLESLVHSRRDDSAVWLDLPGTPERLQTAGVQCATPAVSIEMLVDSTVVASAPVERVEVAAAPQNSLLEAPPAPARAPGRFRLAGQKYGAPAGKRTEAGVSWALDKHVSLQLNFQRTSEPPMMRSDHDDGILTRLRVGF